MRSNRNPITKTLAALAIGAAATFVSTGCVTRAGTGLLETGRTVAQSIEGRSVDVDDSVWLGQRVKNCARNRGVAILATQVEYDNVIIQSYKNPIFLITYSRFDQDAVDFILNFCAYKPSIFIEKGVIADDAKELEGIVGKVLKSGQNVIILNQGKPYGCKLDDLPAWVAAYKLSQEKASANK